MALGEDKHEDTPSSADTDENSADKSDEAQQQQQHGGQVNCLKECPFLGLEKKGQVMIQCIHCATWFHISCIRQKEGSVPGGVWPCFGCRSMPQKINSMTDNVSTLTTDVAQVLKVVRSLAVTVAHLQTNQDQLIKIVNDKEVVITNLRNIVDNITKKAASDHWDKLPKPEKTVLLGSSMTRNIDDEKLVNVESISVSGGKIDDIKKEVLKYPPTKSLLRVVLVVAGNDCDTSDSTIKPSDVVQNYKELIQAAQEVACSVAVSSILPRNKGPDVTERIDTVNSGLLSLCKDLGVEYIDNDTLFYLGDKTLNDGYFIPGEVHINKAGTNRLVERLKLRIRQGVESAYKDHRRNSQPKTTPKPEQLLPHTNDTSADLSHSFWQPSVAKVHRRYPPNVNNSQSRHQGSMPPNRESTHRPRPQSTPVPLMSIKTYPPRNMVTPPPSRPKPMSEQAAASGDSCQLCLGRGHSAVTCHSKTSQCYKCRNVGHLARACSY